MLKFKLIRWKNFLSTGNDWTEIALDKFKTMLVIGENGAGKSTLLDALSFVLYSRPFRRINKPQLINSINRRDAMVEVEFDSGRHTWMIRRGLRPGVFEVFQDGELINQSAETRDYQEYLEKHVLKMNHKSFIQIVVLGSASFSPFMQLPAGHRREVIEDLLDLQIFSVMNTLLKERVNQNKQAAKDIDQKIALLRSKIDLTEKHINELRANNEELITERSLKIETTEKLIASLRLRIDALSDTSESLREEITDAKKVKGKLTSLRSLKSPIVNRLNSVKKDLMFYADNETCPTCCQPINEEFKCSAVETAQQTIDELIDGLNKLEIEISSTEERMKAIEQIEEELASLAREATSKSAEVKIHTGVINSLWEEIERLEKKSSAIADDGVELKKLDEQMSQYDSEKSSIAVQQHVLAISSVLLKDGGIKTRIIRQYVPIINKLVNKYLGDMNFFVQFELNEDFEEMIKSRGRDEFSYNSFSEGEKFRINLALLFAWREVARIRNSAATNLLIMDEIFDSSLDIAGTDDFTKLLSTLSRDTNVIVISPKGDTLADKFDEVVKFIKVKNFSRRVE